jgi:hypothetical protein
MNTLYQTVAICTILLAALCGCEPKPLELDIKMNKPKIVITPVINSGNRLGVLVTRSFSALASPGKDPLDFFYGARVDHARVSIENNGKIYALIDLSPAFVSSDMSFLPYSDYTITVKDTVSGESVRATTTMLPEVDVDALVVKVSRHFKDTALHVRISINDAGAVKKYYLATYRTKTLDVAGKVKKSLIKKSLYDQIELFDNNKSVAGKLQYEKDYKQNTMAFGSRDSLVIDVSEISETYYKYLELYKKSGSFINQLTGEPVNLPTNVKGGAGFFFLLHPVSRYFDLGRY